MLGIIGAMDVEVNSIKSELENVEIKNIAAMDFYKGTLAGKEVVVVKCGIGKVNAAICAQILVSVFGVSALVFVLICTWSVFEIYLEKRKK